MSNKYQEALRKIINSNDNEHLLRCECCDILQELVDKETPMKVTDIHVDEFYCPKCHSEITHDISNYGARPRYCEDCGQKLDWGEYE